MFKCQILKYTNIYPIFILLIPLSYPELTLNKGNSTFENIIRNAMPYTALSGMGIDAADINQDGKVDIFQLDMLPEDNA